MWISRRELERLYREISDYQKMIQEMRSQHHVNMTQKDEVIKSLREEIERNQKQMANLMNTNADLIDLIRHLSSPTPRIDSLKGGMPTPEVYISPEERNALLGEMEKEGYKEQEEDNDDQ